MRFRYLLLLSMHFVKCDIYCHTSGKVEKNDLCFLEGTQKHKLHDPLHRGSALNVHSTCYIPSLNMHGLYYQYDYHGSINCVLTLKV